MDVPANDKAPNRPRAPLAASAASPVRLSKDQLPPSEHLIAALTLARVGSFTKAATELELSQPALSRQIMALEAQLGVRLFERIGRSVHLTACGEELIGRAGPLLEELSRIASGLSAAQDTAAGRVRLGASESIAINILPGLLRPYLTQHRRVSLRLICQTSDRLPHMVASGEIDIAVCAIEHPPSGLTVRQLWEEELVLVLPVSHAGRSRTIASYRDEDFVLLPSSTVTRRLLDRALAERSAHLRVVLEHDSPEVIKAMVLAGLGLAILPESTIRRETRRGELAAWPLTDLKITRRIVAITDPRRQTWPAEAALIQALSAYGR